MASSLPPSFVSVQTAKSLQRNSYASIIGVVVDILQPCQSKGSSFISTFTIKDSGFDQETWTGLKIKYFNDNLSLIPTPDVGDAVMVHGIKIAQFQGSMVGLCTHKETVPWAIFSLPSGRGSDLIIKSSSITPSQPQKSYVISLLSREEGVAPPQKQRTTSPEKSVVAPRTSSRIQSSPRKLSLIKDLTVNTYVDLVVQVVKTYHEGKKFLLYVTDYTNNKALFDYAQVPDESGRDGDEFDYTSRYRRRWPGPFGRMTLQVTLWDPHSCHARQYVDVDDFVFLRNVHIKTGNNQVARLEGTIHTDRVFPNKVGVVSLNDDHDNEKVRDIVKRKNEYFKGLKTSTDRLNGGLENSKRKPGEGEKLSKKAKKKSKKKSNGEEDKAGSSSAHDKDPLLNPNIKTHNVAIPYRSISDILHNESHNNKPQDGVEYRLPFQNVRYKSRLRVVDFFPHRLEEFAVPYKKELDHLSDEEIDDEAELVDNYPGPVTWEWRFCLLVEDGIPTSQNFKGEPKERMELLVAKSDAEFLLNMTAVDLKEDEEAVSQLREKLFLLWGDLEERKREDPENFNPDNSDVSDSTKPFACCIKEYGVKVGKRDATSSSEEGPEQDPTLLWERRFGMFGTNISD